MSYYDQHKRNPQSKAFYNTRAWERCRSRKLARNPACERCCNPAEHVHHVKPITTPEGWEHRLDDDSLMSVCVECHNIIEASQAKAMPAVSASGMLTLTEDEDYYYDADAGERPIRFIEKYLKHFEGEFAEKQFLLHDLQKRIVRDIYGWMNRKTKLRRFRQVWFEAGAGAGKSPLLSALGLYGLIGDNEQGAQIFSIASNYSQARIVFDTAKKFVESSPELAARLELLQYEIRYRKSFWRVVSGKGEKSGFRPSMVLADEVHEWESRALYDSFQSRMPKRRQPLFICATNAGESRASLCWELHERAAKVLKDPKVSPPLYPIIWASEKAIDDPAAWREANPLIGTTIAETKIRDEYLEAKGSPALEARFRRFYLSQWVSGTNKWLEMAKVIECVKAVPLAAIADAPLYVGLDLSLSDDLCGAIYCYLTQAMLYVESHFYLPRAAALMAQRKFDIPYEKYAAKGHITLLDELTVNEAVRVRIAGDIIDRAKGHKAMVCYDRYRADECVHALEAAAIECVAIPQGYSLTPGCAELERRVIEKTVTLSPNPILQAHLEAAEIKTDERGNYWIVKPSAKGKYAGTRSVKVDGAVALTTALVKAREHNWPANQKQWQGMICLV